MSQLLASSLAHEANSADLAQVVFEHIRDTFHYATYAGLQIIIDVTDRFVNASKLVSQAQTKGGQPKQFGNWVGKDVNALKEELAMASGIPTASLTREIRAGTGNNDVNGTYVHPQLLPHLCYWMSPAHAVRAGHILHAVFMRDARLVAAELRAEQARLAHDEEQSLATKQALANAETELAESTQKVAHLIATLKATEAKLAEARAELAGKDSNIARLVIQRRLPDIEDSPCVYVIEDPNRPGFCKVGSTDKFRQRASDLLTALLDFQVVGVIATPHHRTLEKHALALFEQERILSHDWLKEDARIVWQTLRTFLATLKTIRPDMYDTATPRDATDQGIMDMNKALRDPHTRGQVVQFAKTFGAPVTVTTETTIVEETGGNLTRTRVYFTWLNREKCECGCGRSFTTLGGRATHAQTSSDPRCASFVKLSAETSRDRRNNSNRIRHHMTSIAGVPQANLIECQNPTCAYRASGNLRGFSSQRGLSQHYRHSTACNAFQDDAHTRRAMAIKKYYAKVAANR